VQPGVEQESTPPSSHPWWQPTVRANRARPVGLRVYRSPIDFELDDNDQRLLQLLKHLGEKIAFDTDGRKGPCPCDIGPPLWLLGGPPPVVMVRLPSLARALWASRSIPRAWSRRSSWGRGPSGALRTPTAGHCDGVLLPPAPFRRAVRGNVPADQAGLHLLL
jgi:hypothetical protein